MIQSLSCLKFCFNKREKTALNHLIGKIENLEGRDIIVLVLSELYFCAKTSAKSDSEAIIVYHFFENY